MWGLSVAAIAVGAALGAILRWLLGLTLNALWPSLPLGTLLANLMGGYGIGLAVAWLGAHPELSPAWRLFIITGFLGGLTTFSTFSAEVVGMLQQERWNAAIGTIALHVSGSLLLTVLGIATIQWLRR